MFAPGFNPKDTAETYVRKLMANQSRMQLTIQRYEEEQKLKKEAAQVSKEPSVNVAVDAS